MRISDWSSDVCSSDLRTLRNPIAAAGPFSSPTTTGDTHATPCTRQRPALHPRPVRLQHRRRRTGVVAARNRRPVAARSEEHTSELQSLMRISYAVFCLKKKNTKTNNYTIHQDSRIHY